MYSPTLAVTAAPPLLKCPDYGIRKSLDSTSRKYFPLHYMVHFLELVLGVIAPGNIDSLILKLVISESTKQNQLSFHAGFHTFIIIYNFGLKCHLYINIPQVDDNEN